MKQFVIIVVAVVVSALLGAGLVILQIPSLEDTVVVVEVSEGLTSQEIGDSLLSKASELNMKYVGHQPLSTELRNRGIEMGELHIYQFCNPEDAKKLVDYNKIFAAFMPCRIALVEADDGKMYLQMMNLDLLIAMGDLPPDLLEMGNRVNATLTEIINAAARGDF